MTGPVPSPVALQALTASLEVQAAAALSAAGFPADLARAPRPDEIASRTSYASLEDNVTRATREVLAAGLAARAAFEAAIEQQLVGAAAAADVLAVLDRLAASALALPQAEALLVEHAARIRALLTMAALTAAGQTVTDAQAAGIAAINPGLSAGTLTQLEAQATRVAAEAADTALRLARGAAYATGRLGVPGPEFARAAMAAAREASSRALPDVAAQAALRAAGRGRVDALGGLASPAVFYASELLDRSTCRPCSHIDGQSYPDLAAAEVDYGNGQYAGCEGGGRCRGTLVAVNARERAATLPAPFAIPAQPSTGPARV